MSNVSYYSPAERQREKERQRVLDAARLRDGLVSRDDLRAQNGFLASLEVVNSSIVYQEAFA
ncbi:hypothetical protein [Sphingobium yanoikuyae]|nr:hypothetical protein [Sphingobium yanoikuyae]